MTLGLPDPIEADATAPKRHRRRPGSTAKRGRPVGSRFMAPEKLLAQGRLLARELAPGMIRVLGKIASDPQAPAAARVSAAAHLLDRAYGKPAQAIAVDVSGEGALAVHEALAMGQLNQDERQVLRQLLEARRAQAALPVVEADSVEN